MWHYHADAGWWVIIVWIVIIIAAAWVITRLISTRSSGGDSGKNALDIARERYARGEISKEEFDRIKKDLM